MTTRERSLQCAAALPTATVLKRVLYERRERVMEMRGARLANPRRGFPLDFLEQLDRCKDDSARRLLLGIGEPFEGTREARG